MTAADNKLLSSAEVTYPFSPHFSDINKNVTSLPSSYIHDVNRNCSLSSWINVSSFPFSLDSRH